MKFNVLFAVSFLMFSLAVPVFASPGDIHTFAGLGKKGFSGDGGPATGARFSIPYGICAGGDGTIYISDSPNQRIRRVDAQGDAATIAGTGKAGFSGDGGPAASAELNSPAQLCFDAAGGLYFADSFNNRVRKVDASGTITAVAGTGKRGFSGNGGPAVAASLNRPLGVAIDSLGGIYIADSENNCVRKVEPDGIIRAYAGTGIAGYSGDGGPAAAARLSHPGGLAVDADNNLYIADYYNHCVRKVAPSGTITTVAGTGKAGFSGDGGPAAEARLYYPSGVAASPAGLYITDRYNQRVRLVDEAGNIATVAGSGVPGFSGDGGPAASARLNYPFSAFADKSGNIYIGDHINYRVRMVEGPEYGLPVSRISLPAPKAVVGLAPDVISGTASGPAGVAGVEVSTDGGETWASASGTTDWSFTWTPPAAGRYIIMSRATGSDGKAGTLKSAVPVTAGDPASVSLVPGMKKAVVGETVAWTASASGSGVSGRYQFLRRGPDTMGVYVVVRDWDPSNTWNWTTTPAVRGGNSVAVKAQCDGAAVTVSKSFQVVNKPGSTLTVRGLTPGSKAAPAGSEVEWSAEASGGTGSYQYQYMRKGPDTGGAYKVERDWSSLNTWTFIPAPEIVGTSGIKVNIRNSDGTGTASSKEYPKFEVTRPERAAALK